MDGLQMTMQSGMLAHSARIVCPGCKRLMRLPACRADWPCVALQVCSRVGRRFVVQAPAIEPGNYEFARENTSALASRKSCLLSISFCSLCVRWGAGQGPIGRGLRRWASARRRHRRCVCISASDPRIQCDRLSVYLLAFAAAPPPFCTHICM